MSTPKVLALFAIVAVAFAAPGERQERAVYTTYGGVVGSPLAYSATPYVASPYTTGYYSGVPAVSAYSAYPYAGVVGGYPAVRYY